MDHGPKDLDELRLRLLSAKHTRLGSSSVHHNLVVLFLHARGHSLPTQARSSGKSFNGARYTVSPEVPESPTALPHSHPSAPTEQATSRSEQQLV